MHIGKNSASIVNGVLVLVIVALIGISYQLTDRLARIETKLDLMQLQINSLTGSVPVNSNTQTARSTYGQKP